MKYQILHIFKKDARRHWPEILISLALMALFTCRELHPWQSQNDFSTLSPYFFGASGYLVGEGAKSRPPQWK